MRQLDWDQRALIYIGAAVFALLFFRLLTVPALWFDVEKVNVRDSVSGEEIFVDYVRHIRRDFDGKWRVKVFRERDGGWEPVCATDYKEERYASDAVLPDPVTLEWLSYIEPKCYTLPEGDYRIELQWVINDENWLFRREVVRRDTFRVIGVM